MIALTAATTATCLLLAITATALTWAALELARTPRTKESS